MFQIAFIELHHFVSGVCQSKLLSQLIHLGSTFVHCVFITRNHAPVHVDDARSLLLTSKFKHMLADLVVALETDNTLKLDRTRWRMSMVKVFITYLPYHHSGFIVQYLISKMNAAVNIPQYVTKEVSSILHEIVDSPKCLKFLCRFAILDGLCGDTSKIRYLPLPKPMMEYIRGTDFEIN